MRRTLGSTALLKLLELLLGLVDGELGEAVLVGAISPGLAA